MNPSLFSGAIICPVRFAYIALFAAMVTTTSPFAADPGPVGDAPPSASAIDEALLGRSATVLARLLAADALSGTPTGAVNGHQPEPAPVPTPDTSAFRQDSVSPRPPRGSALNTITVLF